MIDKIPLRRGARAGRTRLLVVGTAAGTALGAVVGIVYGRLFDPVAGKRRRTELRDRTAAFFRRGGRRAGRFGRYSASYTQIGRAHV